jgi:hypothetical protein
MAATVEICESNGAGETITHDISNANMGGADAAELDPVSNPIDAGDRSYIKYQRVHVTAMGGSSSIGTLKVFRAGVLGGSATHKTNARTSSYGGALSYATPVNTSVSGVDQDMPTSEPASANLGIGGALAGTLTDVGYSDYLGHQLITDADDDEGSDSDLSFVYSETV